MKLPRVYTFGTITRAFLTGLAFLGPLLLTAIVLAWVFSQLIGFVGPDSLVGHVLTAGGRLFAGERAHPLFSFAIGVLLVGAFVTALGFLVQDRAKKALEEWVDGMVGRIPLLGNVYRPVAQLLRSMGGGKAEEMQSMGVCRVEFGGGVETIAFLASAETYDVGGGPARLVLIPTAPVPIGGALLLVAAHKVHPIPEMKFDDLARLYLTMGMTPPAHFRTVAPAALD
ncbi:DUF502 domain-containing protein [Sandaracinobacter sp. RS1-74]|uniref:DUF502 domain-containing protein n=1 Tax=Sandaracinobacteroides sayramensis TaxID=2913411 RepID=UPI001EDA3F4D|nr:DUF502 domain-containing protein [Sandaracinobacteroides sayramensis]MCG2840516.1 DUF502 domain-containing protein [Sandaracinobacteroides sayramensis]